MHPESLPREIEGRDGEVVDASVESSTRATPGGRLWYWWSLFAAAMLLLILGPPAIGLSLLLGNREKLYPWALFGGGMWLRLCGARVRVRGLEHLDPEQPYVFIANHRSFLDTATLFCRLDRRIGLLAKKELLKVPILGYGMGFVNIMAIDRSNRERAFETTKAATDRIRAGRSFGVFAEGTRALPGELLPFKKGGFYMAAEAGVPVVPVAIKHTDALMGKGTGAARPGLIEMVVLPPVETEGIDTDEGVKALAGRVRALVAEELER
ncbi:MAG TPA: lysophospholipid acyltransferase family protein [Pyrinomonadaceae bacterium]|jgi:1-acyl-sn-glycerol-3-phosphate acyltransferase|nr:lysophospholipid acyltransferase family protein [Pyrinomonadaceae bacterium]